MGCTEVKLCVGGELPPQCDVGGCSRLQEPERALTKLGRRGRWPEQREDEVLKCGTLGFGPKYDGWQKPQKLTAVHTSR